MKIFAYTPSRLMDPTSDKDFPEGVPPDEFIKIEKAMIAVTEFFWKRLFDLVEEIYISPSVFSGEFVVLLGSTTGIVKKENMEFVHFITLCFKRTEPQDKFRFIKIAEVGPDDLTWDDNASDDIIRGKIWEKTTKASNGLVDENMRVAYLIQLTVAFVANLRASRV